MSDFDPYDRLAPARRAIYEKGEAAAQVLRKYETIERWHEVGDAAAALMDDVATYSGGMTTGKGYTAMWRILSAHVPAVRDIDKSARSAAVWMSRNWDKPQDNDNLPSVAAWLATLPPNVRLTLNHPTVVKRRYDATHKAPAMPGKAATPSLRIGLQDTNTALQEELDQLRKLVLPDVGPANLVDTLYASYGVDFVERLFHELARVLLIAEGLDVEPSKSRVQELIDGVREGLADEVADEAEEEAGTDLAHRRRRRRRRRI